MTSENLGELFGALAAARQEFGTLTKGKNATIKSEKGSSYAYAYADLSDVIEATAAALAKHGLVVIQEPEVISDGGRQLVVINGCIAHKSGSVYQLRPLPLPVVGGTAQAIGSAISYGRRYQLSAALNLAAADDDGSEASNGTDAPRNSSSATKTTLKAQSGASAPKRQIDASTGEIIETGSTVPNPFNDATPYYVHAWNQLTGKPYDLVKWVTALHKGSAGECTKKQYQYLTGLMDELTANEHNYALSVLCQSEISKANMVGAKVADTLLKILPPTLKIKDDEGNTQEMPNPEHRADMAEMIATIAAAQVLDGPLPLTDQAEDMRMAAA